MPSASGKPAKRVIRWTSGARTAFQQTLDYIHQQDTMASALTDQRVHQALEAIAAQPGIGTSTQRHGKRKFAIPRTGHTIEYRASDREIIVTRWARQARKA